jgi:hypothetical protein
MPSWINDDADLEGQVAQHGWPLAVIWRRGSKLGRFGYPGSLTRPIGSTRLAKHPV